MLPIARDEGGEPAYRPSTRPGGLMQRQVVRLTWQELYEKMWSRLAISLAEEFGISGDSLGKI